MNTWPVVVGLILAAILALIPLIMIGRLIYTVVASSIKLRRAEARRVTQDVSGLGLLSSTDGTFWEGKVRDLLVTLNSPSGPPTPKQSQKLLSVLDRLPSLVVRAREFLTKHEDMSWLECGAAGFEPYGIDFKSESDFVLESVHPSDPDGIYRVEFLNGMAVSSARDD